MTIATHRRPGSALFNGVLRSAARLARWLLVLVLVADIAGSPLHRHHHDTGIDGSSVHGPLAELQHAAQHVEEDSHDTDFVHAVTTVRAESRAAAPDRSADLDSPDVMLPAPWALPGPVIAAITRRPWTGPDTSLHRLHRSLPPAGRAPPVRA